MHVFFFLFFVLHVMDLLDLPALLTSIHAAVFQDIHDTCNYAALFQTYMIHALCTMHQVFSPRVSTLEGTHAAAARTRRVRPHGLY